MIGRGDFLAASICARIIENTPAQEIWATDKTKVTFDRQGHAVIESQMESGAAIVFFGVR